jgi:hypothetical protein
LEFLKTENGQPVQRHTRSEGETSVQEEAAPAGGEPPDFEEKEAEAAARMQPENSDPAGSHAENGRGGENATTPNDRPAQVTLKLAQLGEPLAVEAGLCLDGRLHPIPVTLLIAATPPAGLVETASGYDNCLVITKNIAAELKLLI